MNYQDTDWLPAQLLEAYHQLSPIGADDVVAVFRGYETATGRDIVLKVLLPKLSASARAVARFTEEAHAAAGLVHSNIVRIYTVDETAGVPYLVTHPVPAESLRAKLSRDRVLPLHTTRAIAAQVGAALTYAHRRGVMHRGLTPDRIFVTRAGHVHVADFGIAAARHTFSLTQLGLVMGTPEYLPPEGISGTFTARSDLYALALIVYELCTGSVPFRDRDPLTILRRQAYERPESPSERGIALGPTFERALLRALSKQPTERFPDADTMLHAIGADQIPESGASSGRHRRVDTTATVRQPATEKPLPRDAEGAVQRPRRSLIYTNWQTVYKHLTALAPTRALLLSIVALLLIVVGSILSASPRSFADGPTESAEQMVAGALFRTATPSSTRPPNTPAPARSQQSAVGIALRPTRTTMPSATPTRIVAPSATPAQGGPATATSTLPPSATVVPSTATATAGAPEPADTSAPVRTLAPLNVRTGPGVAFPVSRGLQTGETVTVLGQNNNGEWLYVEVPAGTDGWIAREFTTFDGTAPIQPAPTQPATPSPVIVATPSSSPAPPASPTLTPLSATQYDAPRLQLPTEGAAQESPINFQWSWDGTLAENEYFDVRLWRDGEPHLGIAWTKVPQLRVENTTLRGTYYWSVAVVRGENGQWMANLSPEAPARTLSVVGADESGDDTSPSEPSQPPQPQPSPTR